MRWVLTHYDTIPKGYAMNKQERTEIKELESHFDRLEHLQLSVKARQVIAAIRSGLTAMYIKEDVKRGL